MIDIPANINRFRGIMIKWQTSLIFCQSVRKIGRPKNYSILPQVGLVPRKWILMSCKQPTISIFPATSFSVFLVIILPTSLVCLKYKSEFCHLLAFSVSALSDLPELPQTVCRFFHRRELCYISVLSRMPYTNNPKLRSHSDSGTVIFMRDKRHERILSVMLVRSEL